MKRKNIPLLLMLTAGAITWMITYIERYSLHVKLIALFVVLLIFYILGSILVWTVDFFERQNEERLKEEGEVIEKDSEGAENEQQDKKQEQGSGSV